MANNSLSSVDTVTQQGHNKYVIQELAVQGNIADIFSILNQFQCQALSGQPNVIIS